MIKIRGFCDAIESSIRFAVNDLPDPVPPNTSIWDADSLLSKGSYAKRL